MSICFFSFLLRTVELWVSGEKRQIPNKSGSTRRVRILTQNGVEYRAIYVPGDSSA